MLPTATAPLPPLLPLKTYIPAVAIVFDLWTRQACEELV